MPCRSRRAAVQPRLLATFCIGASTALILAIVSIATSSSAQDNTPPLIRTTTRLVQLDAVVLDKQNRPVTNLTKDDFRVFDNGVEQQIAHFTGADAAPLESADTSPLVVSNRHESSARGVTAIVMDEWVLDAQLSASSMGGPCTGVISPNDPCSAIRQMRFQVLDFLSKLPPGEMIGIYALRNSGVVVIHDFTDDPAALMAAAKSLSGQGATGSAAGGLFSNASRALVRWSQSAGGYTANQQAQKGEDPARLLTGSGLSAVVKHMEGMPGRKNLVWVSSMLPQQASDFIPAQMAAARDAAAPVDLNNLGNMGLLATEIFPDPQNHFNELQSFARYLGNTNIAVYPFDATGLAALDQTAPVGASTTGVSPYPQWAAADVIATETGGRALFGSNRLSDDLEQIVTEGNHAYQIGYYPGDKAWDGKYHHIELKLAPERKGYRIEARKGYYATDNQAAPSYELMRNVARSDVESPGIAVTLDVPSNPLEWGPEEVVVRFDVHDIDFEQQSNRSNARIELVFVQLGKDGRILEGERDNLQLSLQPDTYQQAEQQGYFYRKQVVVSGYAAKLRVIVRDRATLATGSVSVPVNPFVWKNGKKK